MGYFASGWPKAFAPPRGAHHVVLLLPDPTGRFLLAVSKTALHVWSAGQHRVLLGRFVISDTVLEEEGPFVSAAWAPDALSLIASMKNGLTLVFSVIESPLPDGRQGVTDFRVPELARPEHPPRPLHPVALKRIAESRVAHGSSFVTVSCSAIVGALIATSGGGLTCLTWDGDILWRVHLPELLRKNDALVKIGVAVPKNPDPDSDEPIQSILTARGDDSAGGILALSYEPVLGFLGVVLGSGPSLLLGAPDGCISHPSAVDGRWLRSTKSAAIAMEPRRMLATVGLTDGDVEQFYVGVPPGDVCPVMRRLSLSGWYFEPEDVGAAKQLAWTPDGAALVVGWERRGLAVWSVSGCRLMWTLPQVGGTLPHTPGMRGRLARTSSMQPPMQDGVQALAWGPDGLFLWAAPSVPLTLTAEFTTEPHFVEFTFYKSVGAGVSAQGESGRLALLGTDRVLLLAHADGNFSRRMAHGTPSQQLFSWQHLIIPHDYLGNNWPPSRIAVNDDASVVAVAGRHGIAFCTTKLQRWKVFGDLRHDRRINCCVLGWVGRTIVVGNEVDGRNRRSAKAAPSFELLLYSRDALDLTALQAQCKLKTRPLLMDVRSDGYLLVLCEDSLVYLFHIEERYQSSTELKLVYEIFLPTREKRPETPRTKTASLGNDSFLMGAPQCRIDPSTYLRNLPSPGGGVSEVRIFPSLDQAMYGLPAGTKIPAPKQIMLLRSTGSLILLNTENMVSTPLLRYVERFWYTPTGCRPFEDVTHRPVWWAYGDDGLHVCFRDGMARFLENRDMSRNGIFIDSGDDSDSTVKETLRRRAGTLSNSASRRSGVSVEQWFELDPEVYPLAIMSVSGMVLGATQGLISHSGGTEGSEMPCQVIQVKRQPILHTLLRHLLLNPNCDDRAALQVALKCVTQPQFADSLEWLLYEAVLEHDETSSTNKPLFRGNLEYSSVDEETEEANGDNSNFSSTSGEITNSAARTAHSKIGRGDLFPRVIRLLRYFGEYEDIVVRCARKLDSKRWPLLFSLAGEPAALLEQCFMSGRLRTAACLLVILQEMWGFISSTPHSLRLVQAALARGELSLAADLANFLGKADRAGMLNSSQLRTVEDVSWIAEASLVPRGADLSAFANHRPDEPVSRIPAVDLAVLKHAHVLLTRMDFRNLAALAVRMEFPLAAWLEREIRGKNNRSSPFVRDFNSTILSLHRQFQFVEPSKAAVEEAVTNYETGRQGRVGLTNGIERANGEEKITDGPLITPRTFVHAANEELTGFATDTVFGSQLPPPPSSYDTDDMLNIREKAKHLCKQELRYLLTVAQHAKVPDLMLCFSTLLLDIKVIRAVLVAHADLRRSYIAALTEFVVEGYTALVEAVADVALVEAGGKTGVINEDKV